MTELDRSATTSFAQALTAGFSSSTGLGEDLGRASAPNSADAARIGARMRAAVGVRPDQPKGRLSRLIARFSRTTHPKS